VVTRPLLCALLAISALSACGTSGGSAAMPDAASCGATYGVITTVTVDLRAFDDGIASTHKIATHLARASSRLRALRWDDAMVRDSVRAYAGRLGSMSKKLNQRSGQRIGAAQLRADLQWKVPDAVAAHCRASG
jgi:hypothetical protein